MKVTPPEEIEYEKKHKALRRLKNRLVIREEAVEESRAELEQFEAEYSMEMGRLYADLDEIEAEIALEELKLHPEDEEIKTRAEEAKKRAEASAEMADDENWQACTHKWDPSPEAKKAYYNLAKMIHPDLAIDKDERLRRHELMANLNDAYAEGDQKLLNKLVEEYRDSPELVKGDSIGDNLVRVIRQIYQVKRRIRELKEEASLVEVSELFVLREKVRAEQLAGRNLLKQMAERTRTQITRAQRRLKNLRSVADDEVAKSKDRFGLNVEAFR